MKLHTLFVTVLFFSNHDKKDMIPSPPSEGNRKERSSFFSIGFNSDSDIQKEKDDCTSKGKVVVMEGDSEDAEVFCFDKLTNLLYLSLIHAYEHYSKNKDKSTLFIMEKDVIQIVSKIGTFLFGSSFSLTRFKNFISALGTIVIFVLKFVFENVRSAHKYIKDMIGNVKKTLNYVIRIHSYLSGEHKDDDTSTTKDNHENTCSENDETLLPIEGIHETQEMMSELSKMMKAAETLDPLNEHIEGTLQTVTDASEIVSFFQAILLYGKNSILQFIMSLNIDPGSFVALSAAIICSAGYVSTNINIMSILSSFTYTTPQHLNRLQITPPT